MSIARTKETFEETSHFVKDVTKITVTNNHLNNVENEALTNILFQDLMSKRLLLMHLFSNPDLNQDLDLYEEVVITIPHKNSYNSEFIL